MRVSVFRILVLAGFGAGVLLSGCKPSSSAYPDGLAPKGKDPGPVLKLQPGVAEPKRPEPVTLEASSRFGSDGHFYLRVPLSHLWVTEVGSLGNHGLRPWDLRLTGSRHGAASMTDADLVVRLVGEQPLGKPVEIEIRRRSLQSPWDDKHKGRVGRVLISAVGEAPEDKDLPKVFFRSLARRFGDRELHFSGEIDPFAAFASGRARLLAGDGVRERERALRRSRKTDLGEMMSLYTGMTSVQEALQTDRGLRLRAHRDEERTIPLESISGVPLAKHPWDEMIAALPEDKQPRVEALASRVPQDVLYAHFNDLRTFVKLVGEVEGIGTPLVQIFETRPGDYAIGPRYEEELMVERLGLAERLGHLAAKSVAVVAGDPFLREGADLGVLFEVKDRKTLLSALEYYELRARKAHPDLEVETIRIGEVEVRRARTRDRAVNQFRVEKDGVLYLTNSRSLIGRLLSVGGQGEPALAQAGDFKYMRALYPHSGAPEEGFVFLPDAFIARAVSPRTKILSARRMAAHADLLAVNSAALLYGWLEGRRPEGVDKLLAHGVLVASDLKDADGRSIDFDPEQGASSNVWGRVHALRPLADLEITKATQAEKKAYERFRETYQSYWKKYLDPVAARVRWVKDGDQLEIDVRILPLIENSDYDELVERAGRKTVSPPLLRGAIQWTFAVGEQAKLRKELDQLGRSLLPGNSTILGWLGDWVMIGMLDHSGLWDVALAFDAIPSSKPRERREMEKLKQAGPRMPLYAGAHVSNKVSLAALLTSLRQMAENAAPGLFTWGQGEPYRSVPVVEIGSVDEKEWKGGKICYATVEDVFLLTIGRSTIEALIDSRLADQMAGAKQEGGAQTMMGLATLGPNSWMARTGMGLMESGVRLANRHAFRSLEILSRGLVGLPTEPDKLRRRALAYLGFEPVSPNGGRFIEIAPGVIEHPIYGSLARPKYPDLPVPDSPVTRVIRSLDKLDMNLSFDGEGDAKGLRAVFLLKRRSGQR